MDLRKMEADDLSKQHRPSRQQAGVINREPGRQFLSTRKLRRQANKAEYLSVNNTCEPRLPESRARACRLLDSQ